jgi:hypothetical protein
VQQNQARGALPGVVVVEVNHVTVAGRETLEAQLREAAWPEVLRPECLRMRSAKPPGRAKLIVEL